MEKTYTTNDDLPEREWNDLSALEKKLFDLYLLVEGLGSHVMQLNQSLKQLEEGLDAEEKN